MPYGSYETAQAYEAEIRRLRRRISRYRGWLKKWLKRLPEMPLTEFGKALAEKPPPKPIKKATKPKPKARRRR